jgi:hypothetical protein
MREVVVERYEDETEAETAAGYLRSVGLSARVFFSATMGAPRQLVPIRVVAPLGAFEILVPEAEAEEARRELGARGRPAPRPQRYRWLGLFLVAAWLLPLIYSAIVAVSGLLRR